MIKLKKINTMRLQHLLTILFLILILKIVFEIIFFCTPLPNFIGEIHTNTSYNELLTIKGNVSNIVIKYYLEHINNIPSNIIKSFLDNGGKIYITNQDLSTKENSDVCGIFKHNNNNISIWISTTLINSYTGTLEHEFGHYIDWKLHWISSNNKFLLIAKNEKEAFKKNINADNYFQTNKEYFAECFSIYCLNPKKLKSNCPLTYDIIKKSLESIK